MSQERSFVDRINYFRQQAESQRQADLITRQQQQQQESDRQRQEEIRKQQEIQERVRKTKENFAGTGILEIFQEIIDNRILTFAKTDTPGKFSKRKIIPAKIGFYIDRVELFYGLSYYHDSDYGDSYIPHSICITKTEDSHYELDWQEVRSKDILTNSNEVADRIAYLLAINPSVDFSTVRDYSIIMEESIKYDRSAGIFNMSSQL